MSHLQLPLLLLTLSLCASASALESAISVKKDYDLDADLSYLLNSSSEGTDATQQQSVAAHLDYKRMIGTWGQEVKAEAVGSNSNHSTDNVERYMLAGKMMHSEDTGYYEFAKLQWEKDHGSAFDSQTAFTLGLGSVLYRDDIQHLTGEVGLGARHDIDRIPPHASTTEAIATVAAHYERKLTATVNTSLDLADDYGSTSNTARIHAELSMAINARLSGLFSYDYKKIAAQRGDSHAALTSFGLKYSH